LKWAVKTYSSKGLGIWEYKKTSKSHYGEGFLLTKIIWLKPSDNRTFDTNNSSQNLITVKNLGCSPPK